jgi:hypothetical protein
MPPVEQGSKSASTGLLATSLRAMYCIGKNNPCRCLDRLTFCLYCSDDSGLPIHRSTLVANAQLRTAFPQLQLRVA